MGTGRGDGRGVCTTCSPKTFILVRSVDVFSQLEWVVQKYLQSSPERSLPCLAGTSDDHLHVVRLETTSRLATDNIVCERDLPLP